MPRRADLRVAFALCAALLFVAGSAGADTPDLEARIRELRSAIAGGDGSSDAVRRRFLQRQLLTSLERRRDLAHVSDEVAAPALTVPAEAPTSLLALDDLRHAKQQAAAALAVGARRIEILRADREAAAAAISAGTAALIDGLILKPFNSEELQAKLSEIAARRRPAGGEIRFEPVPVPPRPRLSS